MNVFGIHALIADEGCSFSMLGSTTLDLVAEVFRLEVASTYDTC